MNDDDPKPGVVIDVTPDDEAAATQDAGSGQPPPSTAGRPAAPNRLALGLAVFALVAVAVGGMVGYRYWQGLTQDLSAMDARMREAANRQAQLQQSVASATEAVRTQQDALGEQRELLAQQRSAMDEARNAFRQQETRLADENLRLQEREAELRAAVADVHRRVGRSGTQWIIAETEYLLRIANNRLILARDVETARIALELADQRLRDTGDPGWAGVREQIARDIAQLSTFDAPDIAGLSARLAALIGQVPALAIARTTVGPERTLPQHEAAAGGERSWRTLLDDLWAGFKDAVRIRERDQPVQAMLAPEQQFFLYENLKLHLEAARLGLARGDQTMFRDNLGIAAEWLSRYFEPGDATTVALAEAIDAMRQVDIRPEMPDISQSLRALTMRRALMDDIAPTGAEAQ